MEVASLALDNENMVFAVFNRKKNRFSMIDLIGLTQKRAIIMTQEALTLTQGALAARKLKPNLDKKNHIFKVIAHAGKHSDADKGPKLKFAIKEMLEEEDRQMHVDMDYGVFLVKLTR